MPLLQRAGVLLACGALAHLALWMLGIAAFSERWHATLPFLWLLDWWIFRRAHIANWRARLEFGAIGWIGVYGLCWATVTEQAHYIRGHFDWSEVLVKFLLITSIMALFSWTTRGGAALIEAIFRTQSTAEGLQSTAGRNWARRITHLVRIALTLLIFAPYVYTVFNLHRTKIAPTFTPKSEFGLPYETVSFRANDGLKLRGWWIGAAQKTDRTIVVCHGIGANKAVFLGVTPFLRRAGFNVLFFDFRGHGDSDGHTTTFGWDEARDVVAAVRWARDFKAQKAVALYGFSMGGASVARSIDKLSHADSPLRAVIVDSTFADLKAVIRAQTPGRGRLHQTFLSAVEGFTRLETGIMLSEIAPRNHWPQLKGRPLLIIHGADDRLINVSQSRINFAAARQPKTLMIVPKAGHCLCRLVDPPTYEKRVAQWLRDAMKK